jgi:hypothetical protein
MMDAKPDLLEQRIDSALDRLPQWNPPADFAPRLAAAAARQAQLPAVSPMLALTGNLLLRLSDATLLVLAALSVAGLVIWAVPWDEVVRHADQISWGSAIVLAVSGLWMTRRSLLGR